ncbi:replication factor C (activator 1) 3, putative [Acanthamoeba castellanii str. Neff]|uniref:Replication factor C (Activator 1) 3, putative n=1 Tax=Acanthamoeba castellanii (strain ATCC 30010 / Neff) TaxID=1257118 RepID=L8HFV8_ACACF|nr:replication factor C (activator 1) 3, putative [Acanthamoeba castellanii str. Neff]ELR24424.1 replication factor C (activator 1) 3, putative [Acanthamoeba castellanii str. Neff]
MALLRELFDAGVEKLKIDHRDFKLPSSTTIELSIVSSAYHIELNPSDAGYHDRLVVQEVIKEIAQSPPLDTTNKPPFKVVVLNEVERLSKEAQHALRRTMEKYMSVCRLILCCNSTSKVIDPVRSRCLMIRVAAPSLDEVTKSLQAISKKEGITLPPELARSIAVQSDRNLRKAILMLQATHTAKYPFEKGQRVEMTDWEEFIVRLAQFIIDEQSPKRLMDVRNQLYELLSHCIPPEVIIKKLALELLKKLDTSVKYEVIRWAAFYEHRMQMGSKAIFHLEAFVAKFMSIYKRFLISSMIGFE